MSSQTEALVVERIKVENLLDLPDFILEFILLKLTFFERLAFSMLSKRANRMSLNLKLPPIENISVDVEGPITIQADEVYFCIFPPNDPQVHLKGGHINVKYIDNGTSISSDWKHSMQTSKIKGFIANLCRIGKCNEIDSLRFGWNSLQFPMAFINEILESMPIEEINLDSRQHHVRATIDDMREIANNLPPAQKLYLTFNPFKTRNQDDSMKKATVLRQRKEFFAKPYNAVFFIYWRMNLDDLFHMTSKKILIFSSLCPTGMNLYLKHWAAGGVPTLVQLSVCNKRKFNIQSLQKVLRGINYIKNRRTYTTAAYLEDIDECEDTDDGYDFCGEDGSVATLFFPDNMMHLYVWPKPEVIIEKNNPSRFIIRKLNVHFNGKSTLDQQTQRLTVQMKEGTEFHFSCSFHIQREDVDELRYQCKIKRAGVVYETIEDEIGDFEPSLELQDYDSPSYRAPEGIFKRGEYEVKSIIFDEHDNNFVELEWTLIVTE